MQRFGSNKSSNSFQNQYARPQVMYEVKKPQPIYSTSTNNETTQITSEVKPNEQKQVIKDVVQPKLTENNYKESELELQAKEKFNELISKVNNLEQFSLILATRMKKLLKNICQILHRNLNII